MTFLTKHQICRRCSKEYELGFYGTGPKYCSRECFHSDRNRMSKLRRDVNVKKFLQMAKKTCAMCGRKIITVDGFPVEGGKRVRRVRKYCSKRCMSYAQKRNKSKNGKYFTVKIPLSQLKEMINT